MTNLHCSSLRDLTDPLGLGKDPEKFKRYALSELKVRRKPSTQVLLHFDWQTCSFRC